MLVLNGAEQMKMKNRLFIILMATIVTAGASAADEPKTFLRSELDAEIPVPKYLSSAEKGAICKQYEGTYISFYDDVYKIENCKRIPIRSYDDVSDVMNKGIQIEEAGNRVLSALPIQENSTKHKARGCKELAGKYVTYSYVDIFFVENCKKRLFPDYETYIEHHMKRGSIEDNIVTISSQEYNLVARGKDYPSVVDIEYAATQVIEKQVDVIPIDEACKGVEGKIVAFYSRLYKVEKCRKRPLDGEAFFANGNNPDTKVVELKPEQWLSLPTGKPL